MRPNLEVVHPNFLIQLNSIKKDVLQMVNQLPVEVNIEVADKICAEIKSGNWPKNKTKPNYTIKAMIRNYKGLVI